jgi:hypothetical protein
MHEELVKLVTFFENTTGTEICEAVVNELIENLTFQKQFQ